MSTEKLQDRLDGVRVRITTNQNNTEEATKRRDAAEKKLEGYSERYEAAREERQSLLASGKDVKKINESLKSMQADKELAEDEVIGLDKMLSDLSGELKSLIEEERQTEEAILKSQLLLFVSAYNETAAKLAVIVKGMWNLRLALNEPTYHSYAIYCPAGWDENALTEIPKLFDPNDPTVPQGNSVEAYHFRYRYFKCEVAEMQRLINEKIANVGALDSGATKK